MLKEIDKDKLKKNINNYIAPHFGLVKKWKLVNIYLSNKKIDNLAKAKFNRAKL